MEFKFSGKRLDNNELVVGWFTKKKIGTLIVPVIEVYRESDSGDYIDFHEVYGDSVTPIFDDFPQKIKYPSLEDLKTARSKFVEKKQETGWNTGTKGVGDHFQKGVVWAMDFITKAN